MRRFPFTIAALLVLTSTAMAGSPLEDWERKVGRAAPMTSSSATKILCTCQGASLPTGATGRLVQTRVTTPSPGYVRVYCEVPMFGPSEAITSFHPCVEFVTLAK